MDSNYTMNFLEQLIRLFEYYADKVPLGIFTFFGSLIEEVIAPIPSPFVLTLAGSIAEVQQQPLLALLWISLVGACGKTLGAWFLYFVADKSEDILLTRFGKFLGVTHQEIEAIGKKFGKGHRDDIILLLIRSTPIIPSAPISLVCGLIKMNFRTFIGATFAGTYIRNLLYLYLGYTGVSNYETFLRGLNSAESTIQIIIFFIVLAFVGWAYYKRKAFKNKSD